MVALLDRWDMNRITTALVVIIALGVSPIVEAYNQPSSASVSNTASLEKTKLYLMAGDYRRSVYWAASALCIGAITF